MEIVKDFKIIIIDRFKRLKIDQHFEIQFGYPEIFEMYCNWLLL